MRLPNYLLRSRFDASQFSKSRAHHTFFDFHSHNAYQNSIDQIFEQEDAEIAEEEKKDFSAPLCDLLFKTVFRTLQRWCRLEIA